MHFHELIANQLANGEETGDPHNPREKGKGKESDRDRLRSPPRL